MGPEKTREEALQAALREAALRSDRRAASRRPAKAWRVEATAFIREITAAAALIHEARDAGGKRILRTDAEYTLLTELERGSGCPSISELARTLRISRQGARQGVIAAARRGMLEMLPDPTDRRSIQIALTPAGRRVLASARMREGVWVINLLNGLGTREMRLVAHVLRVIEQRLLRDEQERHHAATKRSTSSGGSWPRPAANDAFDRD